MNEKDQTLTKVFDSISCHALMRLCLISDRFNSLLIWWHPPALWLMVLHMWGTASSAVHELLHQHKLAVAGYKNRGAALVLPCSKLRKPVVQGTMNAKHYMNLTKDVKQARRDVNWRLLTPCPNRKSQPQKAWLKAGTAWKGASCCTSKRNSKCLWTPHEEEHWESCLLLPCVQT